MWLTRTQWFGGDDWAFLLLRGTLPGVDRGLWAPHNEHWSTVPILVYRGLFAVFGLRDYWPYALAPILMHAVVTATAYRVLVRVGHSRWLAAGAAVVLALLGAGAENLLWDFQTGFVGGVMFPLLALLAYLRGSRSWVVWGLLALGLASSSIGLVGFAFVALYAVLRDGPRALLRVAVVPGLVFALWWLAAGRGGVGSEDVEGLGTSLVRVPQFVWVGFTNAWQRLLWGVPGTGGVAAVLLVAGVLWPRARERDGVGVAALALARAGMLAALVQLVLTALGRARYGVDAALPSRYAYVTLVLTLPAAVLVANWVRQRCSTAPQRLRVVGVAASWLAVAGVVLHGAQLANVYVGERGPIRERVPPHLAAALALERNGVTLIGPRPDVENPDLTMDLLHTPAVREALAGVTPTPTDLLYAASNLQVLVSSGPFTLPALTGETPQGATLIGTDAAGCRRYAIPSAATPFGAGASFVVPATGGSVSVSTDATGVRTTLDEGDLTSPPVPWWGVTGHPFVVSSTRPGARLLLQLDGATTFTLC
jgi:hypothetical protein